MGSAVTADAVGDGRQDGEPCTRLMFARRADLDADSFWQK
jgi:hypothetical protein